MTRRRERASELPHASEHLERWREEWTKSGRFVLLLDFDGTLAPIVPHADQAGLPDDTRATLERLARVDSMDMALVSGRGMEDVRERVGIGTVSYAGNHGMEIAGPSVSHRHEAARAARPALEAVIASLDRSLPRIEGAWTEDKGVTLSVHYREVAEGGGDDVRRAVDEATAGVDGIRVTSGKKVFEVRPDVDWHKGRAVEFLLDHFDPPGGAPVLYLGDDTTDEDAFAALRSGRGRDGEGVVVGDPPPADTAALSYVRDPRDAAELLSRIAVLARHVEHG